MNRKSIISASDDIILKLAVIAKEKESDRRTLETTANKLAATAKEKEGVRRKLVVTAAKLAATAKEKESVRRKLAVTATKLKTSYETLEKKVLERTKELADAKAKDEAILASIGDGLTVADETGKMIFSNKNASDIFGLGVNQELTPSDQDKYGVFDPITLKCLSADQMPLSRAVKGQILDKVPLFIRNLKVPDGKFISVTANPIVLNGISVGGVAIFRDMTKEMEIDKAKTEFVSLVSHQLRTPLSTVNWYAEMLLAGDVGELNEKQKKYLGEVYHSNQRMVELVNALLDVSSLELGTFLIEPEPTDICKLTQNVIDEQKPQINTRKIRFSFSCTKNISLIQADPKLLRMVVQNILANAVKYTTPEGDIKLSLSLPDKKNILLKISDTGYGIPKN